MSLKILVVDDTVVFRKIISETLSSMPDVEVVGTASNGRLALKNIAELKPDFITLDVDMPEMDGLEVLEELKRQQSDVGVVMVSALTLKGSQLTIRALELGAFDFIPKPDCGTLEQNREKTKNALQPIVRAFSRRKEIRSILKGSNATSAIAPSTTQRKNFPETFNLPGTVPKNKWDLLALGISTGGPNALTQLLPVFPGDLGVPLLIVQHMPPLFTKTLADSLNSKCALHVKEAENDEPILANVAYIAPGGKQMKALSDSSGAKIIRITDDPPENNCRPSVDYLFRSLAHNFPGRICAIIMTGMGNDGTLGLRLLKRQKTFVIAQDEASSVVFGMPKSAIEAGVVDIVLPLHSIAGTILSCIKEQIT